MNVLVRASAMALGVAVLSIGAAAPAYADHVGTYFSIEYTSVNVGTSTHHSANSADPSGLRFKFGTRLTHSFDIEAQLGAAVDEKSNLGTEFSAAYAGVYLKGHLPLGFKSALFGLAGMSYMDLTQSNEQLESTDYQSGFSYGFGLETKLTQNIDLTADYMRYTQDTGLFDELSAVNFGLKVYF